MQLLGTLPSRLPPWVRGLLTPVAAQSTKDDLALTFDEWPDGSAVVLEEKRTVMPAKFRFGPSACKSVTLRPECRLRLTCIVGAIWVTQERDSSDYVLSAGESLDVNASYSVVAFALQFGVLLVEPAGR